MTSHLDEKLSAYMDGELQPHERDQLRSHLEECSQCSSDLEEVRETRALVRSLPVVVAEHPLPRLRRSRLPQRAAAAMALVAVAIGTAALAVDNRSMPLPATELSVLLTAYTTSAERVHAFTPVTQATLVSIERRDYRLPASVASYEMIDERMWGSDGVVGYYQGSDAGFIVLMSTSPFDTSGLAVAEIVMDTGKYLRGDGESSVVYVWEIREGWMVLLGDLTDADVEKVLVDLPPPAEVGVVQRWWRRMFD